MGINYPSAHEECLLICKGEIERAAEWAEGWREQFFME
jgi:hypothetical protein